MNFCEALEALEELLVPGYQPAVPLYLDQAPERIDHGVEHLFEGGIDLRFLHGAVGFIVDLKGLDHEEVEDLVNAVNETHVEVVLDPLCLLLICEATR